MKKLNLLLLMLSMGIFVFLYSCKDDESPTPDGPSISGNTGVISVAEGEDVVIDYTVSAPGGYKSASVTNASGGNASVTSQPGVGDKSGALQVTFSAAATQGVGSVSVQVMDNNSKTNSFTSAIEITDNSIVTITDDGSGTGTTTWTKDKIYILEGFVHVNDGQVLTVEGGTVIKGKPGQGEGASALIVARGGKVDFQGTANEPIILTGQADDLSGNSIPDDANALWGGVIILGKAPNNNNDIGNEKFIEGLPENDDRNLYGGGGTPDANDDSGSLTFVSIRHGGSVIGSDNEINGLSLGAVGAGTTVDHIEVWSNLDDGIEFFGGTVNVTNVAISWAGDDGLDIDEGYSGNIQYGVVYHTGKTLESDDPRLGEWDGGVDANEAAEPYALQHMANITFYYEDNSDLASLSRCVYWRDNNGGSVYNSIFYGANAKIDIEFRDDKMNGGQPQSSAHRWVNGDLEFMGNILYDINGETADINSNMFQMSNAGGTPPANLETDILNYFAANNVVADPVFGSGTDQFVPSASAVTDANNIFNVSAGLNQENYIGGVAPGTTPFYAGWTKLDEVLNK
jgi:hypothetical protein